MKKIKRTPAEALAKQREEIAIKLFEYACNHWLELMDDETKRAAIAYAVSKCW